MRYALRMVRRFDSFPPPSRIVEVFQAFEIHDKNGNRLLTIPASERPTLRRCGNGIRLTHQQGLTLAKAICRFAKTGLD
jgi:hypothetical protein